MSKIHIPIYMQIKRPETCADCNLCVRRPKNEVPDGSEFKYWCLLQDKALSTRGIRAKDNHLNFRCKPRFYDKEVKTREAEFLVSIQQILKYAIEPEKLPI